jgi:hypothetical protein
MSPSSEGPRAQRVSALETRRLHALAREEEVDRLAVHTQHPTDPHRIEPAVVNQAPDRLGMHAELVGNVTNADEAVRLMVLRRHRYVATYRSDCRIASYGSTIRKEIRSLPGE